MYRFLVTVLFCNYVLSTYAGQSETPGTVSQNAQQTASDRVSVPVASNGSSASDTGSGSNAPGTIRRLSAPAVSRGPSASGAGSGVSAPAASSSLEKLRLAARDSWVQGNIEQAAKQYREVLALSEKSGQADAHVAADLYANGSLSVEVDRLSDARAYFQRALDRIRNQPLLEAQVRMSIGALLALEGNFPEAESDLKSAIAGLTQHTGPNDLRTAKAWNALAWVYSAWGSMEHAGAALDQAQAIVQRVLPPDSIERIPFLDYHAEYLAQLGRYTEAEKLWRQALEIAEKSPEQMSPQFDAVLLHLGRLYSSIGDYKSAQEALERFLSIEKKATPGGSLSQAVALGELGNTYAHLGDRSQAEPTLTQSMDMLRAIPGNVPLANALVGTYLGDYYMSRQRWSDAADQYRQALQTRQELIPNTPLVAGSLNALSTALQRLKRKAEAKRYKKQAQAILSEQYNPRYSGYTVDVKSFERR